MSSLSDLHDLVANMWTKGGDQLLLYYSSATPTVYYMQRIRKVQYIYVVSFCVLRCTKKLHICYRILEKFGGKINLVVGSLRYSCQIKNLPIFLCYTYTCIYVWRYRTILPYLNPPIFLFWPLKTKPPNLRTANISAILLVQSGQVCIMCECHEYKYIMQIYVFQVKSFDSSCGQLQYTLYQNLDFVPIGSLFSLNHLISMHGRKVVGCFYSPSVSIYQDFLELKRYWWPCTD